MRLKKCCMPLAACCLLALCGCAAPPAVQGSDTAVGQSSSAAVSHSSASQSAPTPSQGSFSTETPAAGSSSSSSVFTLKNITPGSIYQGDIVILTPQASGTEVYADAALGLTVDVSNAAEGYIMARCTGADSRIKVRLVHGEEHYDYDLRRDGVYEVYPLQMGSGSYEFTVYQNVSGNKYRPIFNGSFTADMPDVDRVFVYPNQYVWYTDDEDTVKLSYDLCDGLTDATEKAQRIYDYLVWYLSYDDDKADQVKNGTLTNYIPSVDEILELKKGICFDYAAVLASMCRAQGIPVRLVIGYVRPGDIYHAWNSVYLDGKWVWMDATFGPNSKFNESNYTQDRRY